MAYLLIVEDDQDFATAAAMVLRSAGHEVHIETDTTAATRSMEDRCPDLVILDVMFPESASAGFEMARAVRRDTDRFKDVPILMLTAVNTQFPLGFSAYNIDDDWMPVQDFLEKPVDLGILSQRVAALLGEPRQQSAEA